MRRCGSPKRNRSKAARRTRLYPWILLLALVLADTHWAISAEFDDTSDDTSQEAFFPPLHNQSEGEDVSAESAAHERDSEEPAAQENGFGDSFPAQSVPGEGNSEGGSSGNTVTDEGNLSEDIPDEDVEPEEPPMPDILLEHDGEEIVTPPTKEASFHIDIDLANQQDGDGYTFANNILTIHENGAYRLTGGTAEAPLPLSVRIEADAAVTLDHVGISSDAAMTLAPDIEAFLFLSGKNSLSSATEAGVSVPKGARLTIDGNGELLAQGGIGAVFSNPMGCAGIGSGVNMAGGAVVIAGGNILAYGGDSGMSGGAGIGTGGSRGSGGEATLELIEIRGGTVFGQGGESAAGIGTGAGRNSGRTSIDMISIRGGTVTCKAGSWGAEIGTGEAFSSGTTDIRTISIAGGTVNLTSAAEGGAGIGTGEAYNSSSNTIGLIHIAGGIVTAVGGPQGAGIGAGKGYNTNSVSRVERVEVLGGILNVQGGTGGAGIGAGLAQNNGGTSSVGQIIINGGMLTLRGGLSAAGIGSGQGHSRGVSSVDSIAIHGGNIMVANDIKGFDGGAAIGSGEGSNNGQSRVGSLAIHDGAISAVAGRGASAIGAGEAFNSGSSRVDSIDIHGGTISRALGGSSGAGIGSGLTTNSSGTSTVGSINIAGGTITAEGGDSAAGIGTGAPSNWSTVGSLHISHATILAYAGSSAGAIHLEAGELNIDESAEITAFALGQAAISPALANAGTGRLINASFAEDELAGDFYIRSTDQDIRLLLPYPLNHFAVTAPESSYYLTGGYSEQDSLAIQDVTDPENPLHYVVCGPDFTLRKLKVAGAFDGHMVEYRANGASGSAPDDPHIYQDGETVTVMGRGELYLRNLDFAGWNTRPDGRGQKYQEGDSFAIEDTVILYSQWIEEAVISSVPTISFSETLSLPGKHASYTAADPDTSLSILCPSPGWRLTASLGGFRDSFGSHDAIPGGAVVFRGGSAQSADGSILSPVPGRVDVNSGGGAAVIAQAGPDTGAGNWTFHWVVGEKSGISLFVPAGEGSVGAQTATITWTLENVPSG